MRKFLSLAFILLTINFTYAVSKAPILDEDLGPGIMIEAGASYFHSFLVNNYVPPQNFTLTGSKGYSINPQKFFPDDFLGGYFALIVSFRNLLLNVRSHIYETKAVIQDTGAKLSISPVKLTLSVQRLLFRVKQLEFGLGGGATFAAINKGAYYSGLTAQGDPGVLHSESLTGSTRIDSLFEGVAIYHFSNIALKANLAWQIPVHSPLTDGDLLVNLGVAYDILA